MNHIPRRLYPYTGMPMDKVPVWLRSFVDCCDGAALAIVHLRPNVIEQTWVLFRGGEEVGELTKFIPRDN